jgi:predicted ABC-type sugar transport system permease subunit
MAGEFNGYRAALVSLPPFVSSSTSYPEPRSAVRLLREGSEGLHRCHDLASCT